MPENDGNSTDCHFLDGKQARPAPQFHQTRRKVPAQKLFLKNFKNPLEIRFR
jgi:hypothetical protein